MKRITYKYLQNNLRRATLENPGDGTGIMIKYDPDTIAEIMGYTSNNSLIVKETSGKIINIEWGRVTLIDDDQNEIFEDIYDITGRTLKKDDYVSYSVIRGKSKAWTPTLRFGRICEIDELGIMKVVRFSDKMASQNEVDTIQYPEIQAMRMPISDEALVLWRMNDCKNTMLSGDDR